jgi:hypothetical protein
MRKIQLMEGNETALDNFHEINKKIVRLATLQNETLDGSLLYGLIEELVEKDNIPECFAYMLQLSTVKKVSCLTIPVLRSSQSI